MFRKMRRFGQQLPENEAIEILKNSTAGVLALQGDDGYPYTVPMSHFYRDGKLYFHCAMEGHKYDAVRSCDKASFCVIEQDDVMPEQFTTLYRSVVAFGRIRIVEDAAEKLDAMRALSDKYSPGDLKAREEHIFGPGQGESVLDAAAPGSAEFMAQNKPFGRLCLMEMVIEHMTGKESRELMAQRRR